MDELCRAGRKSPNAGRTKSRSGACAGSLHGALAAHAALLSAAERQVIDDAAAHLSEVAQGDDVDAIEQAIKNVDKQTQDFAARRMDQSVRRALKGHSVDEV